MFGLIEEIGKAFISAAISTMEAPICGVGSFKIPIERVAMKEKRPITPL